MKLIDKMVQWYLKKQQKEKKETQKKIEDVKLHEAIARLKALYSFAKFLNEKAFKNRHERKNFWRSVGNGQNVMESTIINVLERYGVKPESIVELKKRKEDKIRQNEELIKKQKEDQQKKNVKTCPPDCGGDCSKCANKPQPSESKKMEDAKKNENK